MINFKIIKLKEVDSTQKYCKLLGLKGQKNIIVVSETQTAGKGRMDRFWYSHYGGLYFSMLLDINNINIEKINFITSLSILNVLKKYSNKNFKIKFPNDIILENENSNEYKKICGILSEINLNNNFLIVGIGVNINNTISEEIKDRAISLKDLENKEFNNFDLLNDFIVNFNKYLNYNCEKLLENYKLNCSTIGKKVKIILPNNELVGIVKDINYNGLILNTEKEDIIVSVGDCVYLRGV